MLARTTSLEMLEECRNLTSYRLFQNPPALEIVHPNQITHHHRLLPKRKYKRNSSFEDGKPTITAFLGKKLLLAVTNGNFAEAKAALMEGAPPDFKNKFGETAVHIAATHGNRKMLHLLIAFGANANARNIYGDTPLFYAHKHSDIVRYLVDVLKVDTTIKNKDGFTYENWTTAAQLL